MKTVMKKMFSLLLVAVLLVSAVPVAFADTQPQCDRNHPNPQFVENNQRDVAPTCTTAGKKAYLCNTWDGKEASDSAHVVYVEVPALHHSFNTTGLCQRDGCGYQCPHDNHTKYNGGKNQAATCTTAGFECHKCDDCGAFISVPTAIDSSNHSYDQGVITTEPTCTDEGVKTFTCACGDSYTEPVAALNHDVVNGQCTRCPYTEICPTCKQPLTADHTCKTVLCPTCKDPRIEGTDHTCATLTCATCNETYTKGTSHLSGCPYCTECLKKGDKNQSHAASAHCAVCGVANGHTPKCSNITYPAAGNVNLYVWANLYTGQVKTGSILLDTITGLSGSEHVYQVVANNEGRIRSKIPAGYGWTGHIYYEQDPKTVLQVHSNLSVSAEDDVVINLYTDQKLVVARVHTNKTYAIDHTINIDGFTVGQTVTSNDVLKAVQKHYNVSSLKMYTPAEWEKVVSGKTGTVIPNYEVHGGDNIIDVYVTGSYKTTSGTTYKADSSNPKTGDEIFVPMTVLFASVSSLAVLLYLNKKRAI